MLKSDSTVLLKSRIRQTKKSEKRGSCVLYVMSRDQRVADNHALLSAQKHAIAKELPLAAVFCLYEKSGYRAREHYEFMLEGFKQVELSLQVLNIPFMMLIGPPIERLQALIHHTKPDAVYFDFNPLRGPRLLLNNLSKKVDCSLFVVDTHNIIPVWETSEKYEIGAYTIRPKIHKKLGAYLEEPEQLVKHPFVWPGPVIPLEKLDNQIREVLHGIKTNGTVNKFQSGEVQAHEHLEQFINDKLESYALQRNDPSAGVQSELSPYLHFGQMSALRVALRLREVALQAGSDLHLLNSPKMPKPEESQSVGMQGINALIEEMVVRKELADNYCYYQPKYDSIDAAPKWARTSLETHRIDPRDYLYSYDQLRDAQTHDEAWNAAQRQMISTGKMHGYMRMYWAKKVLEWTESPEQAIDFLIRLNDHYSIDGGDPNGYAGILWSVAGVHDRPWFDRPIFGVVRYMNFDGLKRKYNIEYYCKSFSS
jgi:deoxyribodipyrimidine photo-lyase